MVAPASRGSLGGSLASAVSSACATGSPPAREKPRDNSVPAASTMTAPTENAVSDGGHCHASEIASRIQCSSPLSIREPYPAAALAVEEVVHDLPGLAGRAAVVLFQGRRRGVGPGGGAVLAAVLADRLR